MSPDRPDPLPTDLRELLEADLICPHCTSANRPGVTNIELAQLVCFCRNCSKTGPLSDFQKHEH